MMRQSFSFLSLMTIASSFAQIYFNNDNLFSEVGNNNIPDLSFFDFNLDDDPIFSSFEDGSDVDLLADCLTSNGGLEARDTGTTTVCPAKNDLMPIPQFPTLDQVIDKATPSDSSDENRIISPSDSNDENRIIFPIVIPGDPRARDERLCHEYHPYYLCCLCDFVSSYCHDCLPS